MFQHAAEDEVTSFYGGGGMYERIIGGGTVDYAGKQCAFRERQIFGGFSEISFRGGAYTEYVVPEINNVQIVFEYCFFVVFTIYFYI